MKREEFDHAIRAAGSILGVSELLVIGSQAIHASVEAQLPVEAMRSVEVDIAAFDDLDASKADLIDGAIGEASIFHETFGFYAQGVSETTATLPAGWRHRLVRYESPATGGVIGWCLGPHDLWISKAVAGRPKDYEFCMALLRSGLVEPDILEERLAATSGLADQVRSQVLVWIHASQDS
jgi:hypothetical protein